MMPALMLGVLLGFGSQESQPPPQNQASLVERRDLPNDLNLPFRENGFTVATVTIVNQGNQPLDIDTTKIRVLNPKNKEVPVATSADVVPKMVKSGARVPNLSAGGTGGVYRPGYGRPGYGSPGYGRPIEPGVTIGGSGGGVIDIGRVERLKATIEKYQLKSTHLRPGEHVEGFLYLKTDKPSEELKGTRIIITPELSLTLD